MVDRGYIYCAWGDIIYLAQAVLCINHHCPRRLNKIANTDPYTDRLVKSRIWCKYTSDISYLTF